MGENGSGKVLSSVFLHCSGSSVISRRKAVECSGSVQRKSHNFVIHKGCKREFRVISAPLEHGANLLLFEMYLIVSECSFKGVKQRIKIGVF